MGSPLPDIYIETFFNEWQRPIHLPHFTKMIIFNITIYGYLKRKVSSNHLSNTTMKQEDFVLFVNRLIIIQYMFYFQVSSQKTTPIPSGNGRHKNTQGSDPTGSASSSRPTRTIVLTLLVIQVFSIVIGCS